MSSTDPRTELTVRGVILGALITLVFTAANVFLGLRVGLTFASSIPAAVISMAILRGFKTATIQENNIVQTVASAAGTLSSVIFVLPGLVIIGWWAGFPFWEAFLVCALGGLLGIMYSIPLRRALVTNSDLPYPEGVAAAEVLKVGAGEKGTSPEAIAESRAGVAAVVWGSIVSAGFAILTATGYVAGAVTKFWKVAFNIPGIAAGTGITGVSTGLSFALLGAGHLVGLSVGIAMLAGIAIAWAAAVPYLTSLHPMPASDGEVATLANTVFRTQVRFLGAGTIGVAAIWTLLKLIRPVIGGLMGALAASRERAAGRGAGLPRTEQDIPIGLVALISLASLVPIAILLAGFIKGGVLQPFTTELVVGGLVYVVVIGLLIAAVVGYMAGLIGSSNSPLSGVGILAVVGASVLLALFIQPQVGEEATQALIAFALIVTGIVFTVGTISNDNLQDLKTGQLVDATPWKQQVALVFGVLAGAVVIPPILVLLNEAYGFAGAQDAGPQALPAPQANLISDLARGVLKGDLDWGLLGAGAAVGAGVVLVDELLGRLKLMRLPPLAVGLGVYLPMATTLAVVVGAVLGFLYNRAVSMGRNGEVAKRLGVLLASGLIVGESLWGVVNAGIIVAAKAGFLGLAKDDPRTDNPLGLAPESFADTALQYGLVGFAALTLLLYFWTASRANLRPAK